MHRKWAGFVSVLVGLFTPSPTIYIFVPMEQRYLLEIAAEE